MGRREPEEFGRRKRKVNPLTILIGAFMSLYKKSLRKLMNLFMR